MTCDQALALISARMDREIQAGDRASLESHLQDCPACCTAAEALQSQDADLRRAYARCEGSGAVVAERALAELRALVRDQATPPSLPLKANRSWPPLVGFLAAAAALVGMAIGLRMLTHRPAVPSENEWVQNRGGVPAPKATPSSPAAPPLATVERLVPRLRAPAVPSVALAVGQSIHTKTGERRRVSLTDGSVLYVNQDTEAKLDAERHLALAAGEVFVEVAPREQEAKGASFVVKTPDREVAALGTKFAVRAQAERTGVVVTQGKVQVSGLKDKVVAGQQLVPGTDALAAAPRASHVLDWTRDLMATAESPLVPNSQYAGGALVAVDPYGQEAKLSLRKYHIDVHIEDGFARTTIDQTYFNQAPWRMEGTFYFPLPPDASLSRLAMYVGGELMEGGMAERDYARTVFETIMTRQKDPALLEWVDGSTFKMRVFPLEGRQEKRIILSYTQRLDSLYGRTTYRFPAGHSLQVVGDWSLHARVKGGAKLTWSSDSHTLKTTKDGDDLILDAAAQRIKPDRDVVLELTEDGHGPAEDVARFSSALHENFQYLMLRYRPTLPSQPVRQRRDWVFLFESSADRDPLLARVQVDVIRTLLNNAEHDDTFAILTAGTHVGTFAREARPATPENVKAAVDFLEHTHLVGALDLGAALAAAEPFLKGKANPYLVHVGSGIAALGERREDVLAKRIPQGVHYVGVGVGRRWSRAFMKVAAEQSGGYFTQINPDEPVAWRAFELYATLGTPRLQRVQIVDNAEQATFLSYAGALAQGEELCAIARIPRDRVLPASVTITATLDGQPFQRVLPVRDVVAKTDYLPRTWAKLEIERLVAENAEINRGTVVSLSKAMYVMTPFTSLLVLENEAMYAQYKVDRGRKDHWALYLCPQKIPVVTEVIPGQPADARTALKGATIEKKPSADQVRQTILVRVPPPFFATANPPAGGQPAVTALQLGADAYALPEMEERLEAPQLKTALAASPAKAGVAGADKPSTQPATRPTEPAKKGPETRGAGGFGGGAPGGPAGMPAPAPAPASADRTLEKAPESLNRNGSFEMRNLGVEENRRSFHKEESKAKSWEPGDAPVLLRQALPDALGRRSLAEEEGLTQRERFAREQQDMALGLRPPVKAGMARAADVRKEAAGLQTKRLAEAGANLADEFFTGMSAGSGPSPLLYQRPSFSGDGRVFFDLVSYAPEMNTTAADIQAVLEAEAAPDPRMAPGMVEPAARTLIERARAAGWQALTLPAEGCRSACTVVFDGSGRFSYERVLPDGLHEHAVCDGQTLWHLYPELGVGARRVVSRFHRAEFVRLVSWALPPVEDLARGADLTCLGERTVAVIPHEVEGKAPVQPRVHLVFADSGRLAERQVVEMPAAKTLYREVYGAEGVVKLLDGDGQTLTVRKAVLRDAPAPELAPDTKKLVVLPLPYRTVQHVHQVPAVAGKPYEQLDDNAALTLFAANLWQNPWEAQQIFGRRFHARGNRLPGFHTLLAAAGLDAGALQAFPVEPTSQPLIRYLAFHSNPQQRQNTELGNLGGPAEGFLQRLSAFHDLYIRWHTGKAAQGDETQQRAEVERGLDYVRRNSTSVFGWAMLGLMRDQAGNDRPAQAALAEAYRLFDQAPGLAYAARYEHAAGLLNTGRYEEARALFLGLYAQTLKEGTLPPIDSRFEQTLLLGSKDAEPWQTFCRQTAATLIAADRRIVVIDLAWQCSQLGDQPLADDLLARALDGVGDKDRLAVTLAGVEYLWQSGRLDRADALLQPVLADDKIAKDSSIWRLAAALATQRKVVARSVTYLDRALEMEYTQLPAVIDLQAVRADYGRLLAGYQQVAAALTTLESPPPHDFMDHVVRAADRWRSLDSDGTAACQAAARILKLLGANELAWDYLTTPSALHPNEAAPHMSLAQLLRGEGDFDLADREYELAFEAEPTNAQILWERAQALQQAGKVGEAQRVYRRLAEGPWQPRFQGIQQQARRWLGVR